MTIEELKEIALRNTKENVSVLFNILELFNHPKKNDLNSLLISNHQIIEECILNVIILYSLHAFIYDTKELQSTINNITKLIKVEPVLKELLGVYSQIVSIKDINEQLTEKECLEKDKALKDILLSF